MAPKKDTSCRASASSATGYLQTPIVKIIIGTGESKRVIYIHEGIICDRSEFFKKALSGEWREAQEKTVELPEDDPVIFAFYQELLYTGVLPIVEDLQSDEQVENSTEAEEEYVTLGKLYVLAEKLLDATTKDMVLKAFIARSQAPAATGTCHFPDIDCVCIVYDGTPEGDPARALLVEFYNDHGVGSWMQNDRDGAPRDFLFDLSISMLDKRPPQCIVDSTLDKQAREHTTALNAKTTELRKMKADLQQKERSLEIKDNDLTRKGHENGALKSNVREKHSKIQELEKKIKEKDADITLLNRTNPPPRTRYPYGS